MITFQEYLTEATKEWAGFDDLPSRMDKELAKFFKTFKKYYGKEQDYIYIDDNYNFSSPKKQLVIKVTDKSLVKKIANSPYLSEYMFTATGENFKSTEKVNVIIKPSGGVRGSGRLPRKGQGSNIPSTDQQEAGTIVYFEGAMSGKPPTVQEISKKVGYDFDEEWMHSFVEQYNAFHENMGSLRGHKIYLDSGRNDSNILIKIARKLGLSDLKDNWNPADIWIMSISQNKIISDTKGMKTLAEFNGYLEEKYDSKEIIGVSLKKISKNKKAKFELVKAVDLPEVDLKPSNTIFNPFAKNFILMTSGEPSGLQFRVGYKASTVSKESDVRIYLEGRMKGSNVQLGGVSSKLFPEMAAAEGFNIAADKKKIMADPSSYLNKTLPKLLKNPMVEDNVGEFPTDPISLQAGAFLTYYLDIMMSSSPEMLKNCYYSSIKKNEFSSIHCKIY